MIGNCTFEDLDSYIAVEKNGIVSLNTETPCDNCIFAGVNCYGKRKAWIRNGVKWNLELPEESTGKEE